MVAALIKMVGWMQENRGDDQGPGSPRPRRMSQAQKQVTGNRKPDTSFLFSGQELGFAHHNLGGLTSQQILEAGLQLCFRLYLKV